MCLCLRIYCTPNIHFLSGNDFTPEELAQQLANKVKRSKQEGRPTAELGPVVQGALKVRLPKVVPTDWSKYEELGRIFDHLASSFSAASGQLLARLCMHRQSHA